MKKSAISLKTGRFLWILPVGGGIALGGLAALFSFQSEKMPDLGGNPETSQAVIRKNDSLQTCGKAGMTRAGTMATMATSVPAPASATLPRRPHD